MQGTTAGSPSLACHMLGTTARSCWLFICRAPRPVLDLLVTCRAPRPVLACLSHAGHHGPFLLACHMQGTMALSCWLACHMQGTTARLCFACLSYAGHHGPFLLARHLQDTMAGSSFACRMQGTSAGSFSLACHIRGTSARSCLLATCRAPLPVLVAYTLRPCCTSPHDGA